jgi:hypothetical protein
VLVAVCQEQLAARSGKEAKYPALNATGLKPFRDGMVPEPILEIGSVILLQSF